MANHTIKITAAYPPPFDYNGDEFKVVKKTHKVRWTCNVPFAVVFKSDSPFDTGEKFVIGAPNTNTSYLTIRPPKNNAIEVLPYAVVAYVGGELLIDDPVIIIDNDGGGGGGMKRAARKKAAKKKAAKK
jgi:hypothetical protein